MSSPNHSAPSELASSIRVLLADDEPHLGAILEQFLVARGFSVRLVRDGRAALDALQSEPFDVALLDVVMPELDGLEVLRRLREESTPPEILVITGNGTVETALAALRLGAYDVLSKPYRMAEIEALIRRAWEKRLLVRENHRLRARLAAVGREAESTVDVVTQYAPLRLVLDTLQTVRDARTPVVVWGAPGCGKRALARWFHAGALAGPAAPFIEWNATGLTAEAARAALFGREGAPDQPLQIGVLEQASTGTLLVRAVARLDHETQRLLERAVARGVFVRVGGQQPIALDARVIVALMRDPDTLVEEGTLDGGLLHTLSSTRVALPTLRERAVDIPLLAEHLAARVGRTIGPDAIAWLEEQAWPHNVRSLQIAIERAARAGAGTAGALTPAELAAPVGAAVGASASAATAATAPAGTTTLEQLERAYIAETLEAVHWHQGRAAEALGISPKTLYRKIREYGFKRPSGRTLRADVS
jgi:DNA-binding NtrC family response regulator